MAVYAAEVYSPGPGASLEELSERLRDAAEAITRDGAAVRYVRSLFLPGDETCFHVFEADSTASVSDTTKRAGVLCARIVEAIEGRTT